MRAYLDHAATTPMRASALAAMTETLAATGNASSVHASGRAARRIVEESREQLAQAVGAHPSEVVFTSGGTEADNLAVKGTYAARARADAACRRLLCSGFEHHAVLDSVEHLATAAGAVAQFVEPDDRGIVTSAALRDALGPDSSDVALVSVMWANNEIGTIAPVAELAAVTADAGVPIHSDAVQALGQVPIDFAATGLDLLSVSGHKVGGPMGVGALVARRGAQLQPLSHGGGAERNLRPGTVPVAAVRAFAVAAADAVAQLDAQSARLIALRDKMIRGILGLELGIRLTGAWTEGSAADRVPGNVHVLIPGTDGDSLLFLLDTAGVECSTGSACQAGVTGVSHVVRALGFPDDLARGALRLTLGHTSTHADVEAVIAALPVAVERARRARGAA